MLLLKLNSIILILLFFLTVNKSSAYHYWQSKNQGRVFKLNGLIEAINEFSFELYQVVNKGNENENHFYSPIGIIYAFSMLMIGAKKDSELEVFRGLHLDQNFRTPEEAHKSFRLLLKVLERNANYSLDMANIILTQKDNRFLKEFTKRLGSFYKVAIGEVDFLRNGRKVMNYINQFVSNSTHNKIKDFVKRPLDPLTRLVILNAVYFKAEWRVKFDGLFNKERLFYNNGKTPNEVTFMFNYGGFGYFEDKVKKYKLLEMQYSGEASFLLLLPFEKDGLDNVLQQVTMEEILQPLDEKEVSVWIPKFKLEGEYDLKKVLPDLGIKAIFGPGADLSGINGDKTLFVTSGVHKAMVEVNEAGTEAAAATSITILTRLSSRYVIDADHPFLFIIRDTKYNLIYFMGKVNIL
ncbi:leukocyte elastase inhibitor-like protein [Dinothrombium tinctorium]|uniref:Leukocyte elastase inhibitor-like protein n=1 Tax=Dinothrombium tinctorium TaxID=1965070 RepID=A0A3S3P8S2_9ACAR|nr:leukocyte elastase inhibitor-like protein [Dinothrombium tinctorium]RWS17287.1 leukocyte elastase inhibitor-like protein [Dinothrombium tinctorium]RWS17317.1 leukocyte elastase inhibitor-like protein [Dinothrombium tinctorium]